MNRDMDLEWEDYKDEFKILVDQDDTLHDMLLEYGIYGWNSIKGRLEVLEEVAINTVLSSRRDGGWS